jgi:hypothetical protein
MASVNGQRRSRVASPAPTTKKDARKESSEEESSSSESSKIGIAAIDAKKELAQKFLAPTKPLRTSEVFCVVAFVASLFGGILLAASRFCEGWPWPVERPTLSSVWDHPEPNFAVSEAVAEFWSVLTTFPIAGALLLYQAWRFRYSMDVVAVGILTCTMYTNACVAHCTLHTGLFTTTVLGVCNNALYSFGKFGYVVGGSWECCKCRYKAILTADVLVLIALLNLPYIIGDGGGVWTLFTVQTPPVIYAWHLALQLRSNAQTAEEKNTYSLASAAGKLLTFAMAVSLVECLIGFQYGYMTNFFGFPWLHIVIHVSEQIGIYMYGVAVAALRLTVIPKVREGAKVQHLSWGFPYVYCPTLPDEDRILKVE